MCKSPYLLEKANQQLARCLMYDGKNRPPIPLMKGQFWNLGYFRTGIDPLDVTAQHTHWHQYVTQAEHYADMLKNEVYSSSIDSTYYPFLLPLENNEQDEAVAVKHALGLNVNAAFIDVVGDIILEKRPHARSIFWDADIDDEVEEYFSATEIQTYLQVTAAMHQDLQNLQVIRFPDGYTRYPVFFVGTTNVGDLVGVVAFRLDR